MSESTRDTAKRLYASREFYHAAPASARDSILAYGLDCSKKNAKHPASCGVEANYVFRKLENAERFARWVKGRYGKADIWAVQLHSSELGRYDMGTAYVTTPIPPSKLRLHSTI